MTRNAQYYVDRDAANPQIWTRFEELALKLMARGFKSNSARSICGKMRWDKAVDDHTADAPYDMITYYARKFMSVHPQYKGFFKLRKKKADDLT